MLPCRLIAAVPSGRSSYRSLYKFKTAAVCPRSTFFAQTTSRRYASSSAEPKGTGQVTPSSTDHRDVGNQQKLFITSTFSPGSPLFTPRGTKVFQRIVAFIQAQNRDPAYQEVITPTIYKKELWERSGHWDVYSDAMFEVSPRSKENPGDVGAEEGEWGLKPMNCPGHCLLFDSEARSYNDLPIRFSEFGALHRNELSGALSGLTRVRKFHQDDGHVFCRPTQVKAEIKKMLDSLSTIYRAFQLPAHRLVLSTRPDTDFIGSIEDWNNAEKALTEALEDSGQSWSVNAGDGAFYGPKIDISLRDSDGKEHQTATIQLDFQLPKRFALKYQAPAPELEEKGLVIDNDAASKSSSGPVQPVLIHRAMIGSVERFIALLSEHYRGKWPFWLSPRQVQILTVGDSPPVIEYAKNLQARISSACEPNNLTEKPAQISGTWIECDINSSKETVGKKIVRARQDFWSVQLVVGSRDIEKGTVTADFGSLPESSRLAVDALLPQPNDQKNQKSVEMTQDRFVEILNTLCRTYL